MDPIKLIRAKHYQRGERTAIDLVVIHTAECPERPTAAEAVASYFTDPRAKDGKPIHASAHYTVDNDTITCSVLEKDVAWHTPGKRADGRFVNNISIGVEHAGYARQKPDEWDDDYSRAMLERSAELVAGICVRYGVPIRKLSVAELAAGERGICGHVDCTVAFNKGKGHTDPGASFPWERYIEMVTAFASELEPQGAA